MKTPLTAVTLSAGVLSRRAVLCVFVTFCPVPSCLHPARDGAAAARHHPRLPTPGPVRGEAALLV